MGPRPWLDQRIPRTFVPTAQRGRQTRYFHFQKGFGPAAYHMQVGRQVTCTSDVQALGYPALQCEKASVLCSESHTLPFGSATTEVNTFHAE